MPKPVKNRNSRSRHLGLSNLRRFNPLIFGLITMGLSVVGYLALTKSFAASTTLYMSPANATIASNGLLNVAIRVATDEPVRTVRVQLPYPTSMLQYVGSNGSASAFTIDGGSPDNGGTIYITRTLPSGSSVIGDQLVTNLTFKVIATSGIAVLTPTPAPNSLVLRASDNQNTLSGTNGGSYTVSQANAPSASVAQPQPPSSSTQSAAVVPKAIVSTPATTAAATPPSSTVPQVADSTSSITDAQQNPTTTPVNQATNDQTGSQFYDASQLDTSAGPAWPPAKIAAASFLVAMTVIGVLWLSLKWWDRQRVY